VTGAERLVYTRFVMPASSYHRLVIARELLRARYSEPLPLRELAAAADLSEFHFLRAYRAAFGETPHQHFTRLRLEHAKRALARGARVTEVCFDVGYSSLGSFSALFARATGRSPRTWQREVRALIAVPADLPRLYIPGCFLGFFVDHGPLSRGSQDPRSTPIGAHGISLP
jgi:AraC-like DNA-binding protein